MCLIHAYWEFGCFSLGASMRVEFKMNVSSDATWINAASNGLSIPAAAKPMPMESTISVP
jgi:hypothetical protein